MTVKEWLESLTKTNQSTEDDSIRMQNLLRRIAFPYARVVIGIVYPEGTGRPIDIHSMARMILGNVPAPVKEVSNGQ